MIKIFSIKEIVDASNSILNRKKKDKNETFNENLPTKKLSKRDLKNTKKSKLDINYLDNKKLNEPLILTDIHNKDYSLEQQKSKSTFIAENKIHYPEEDINKREVIDELYELLKKKIRKNTIKIIFDQQLLNKKLHNIISELRKNELKNLKKNKILKEEISHLKNNEKILNFKFQEFEKNLKLATEREFELVELNRNLENENFELKSSINSKQEYFEKLEKNNHILKNKIENMILNERQFVKANNQVQENIITLTETKNYLSEQTDQLKKELVLIKENEKLLLKNNIKLNQEVSLLSKNKKILIDINDQYQERISNLEKGKIKLNEEKIELEKINISIEDTKQTLLDDNYNLKDQITTLINKEKILVKSNKSLERENNSLKNESRLQHENKNKILTDMNTNLQYELSSLRANEVKLVENNKKLHNELINLRKKNSKQFTLDQTEQLSNLKQKLNFHQDENLRLSHELSKSQKKYKLIKDQLEEIDKEKRNITKKIDDLTSSLTKTTVVTKIFDNKKDTANIKKEEKKEVDLEDEIKKIFS